MASPAPEQFRPLRRVEYDQLVALGTFDGERIELIDGALRRLSPIGPPHTSTVDALTELLVLALVGRARVRVQGSFAASDLSEPEPAEGQPAGDDLQGRDEPLREQADAGLGRRVPDHAGRARAEHPGARPVPQQTLSPH